MYTRTDLAVLSLMIAHAHIAHVGGTFGAGAGAGASAAFATAASRRVDRCAGVDPQQYVFHLNDLTCQINDPNGPLYDPAHGVYHVFYQDHTCFAQFAGSADGCKQAGPVWGHFVSRDFLHWAQMPVALWNDQWYDREAVFSGAGNIINGTPVLFCPGIVVRGSRSTYNVALPTNRSDPLLTDWSKPGYNPVLNSTGDDPTNAWQTVQGEYRLVGNKGCGGKGPDPHGAIEHGSRDFVTFYEIGCTNLPVGPNPTLFPLPPRAPGVGTGGDASAVANGAPTHVFKVGADDAVSLGVWTEGAAAAGGRNATAGVWKQVSAWVSLDCGCVHAARDFWDPVHQRRVVVAWVNFVNPNDLLTVPREATYDSRLGAHGQLVCTPARELLGLRTPLAPFAHINGEKLVAGSPPLRLPAAAAADVELLFARPSAAANLTVQLPGGVLFLNYSPGAASIRVGFHRAAAVHSPYRNRRDGDNRAQARARRNGKQQAPGCFATPSGVAGYEAALPMLPSDTLISVRLLLDTLDTAEHGVAEAYFMGGRTVLTVPLLQANHAIRGLEGSAAPSAAVGAGQWDLLLGVIAGEVDLVNGTSWGMGNIHVTPEQVLATPRKSR